MFSGTVRSQQARPKARSVSQNHADTPSPVTRTAISLEYASLRHRSHCPLGMYVLPSVENISIWDAVFFVHQGYYADAVLRFRLTFPADYPDRPPTVNFVTDIFHPLIGQNGVFNLTARFRPWRPKEHHVFDVLHFIKATFKKQTLDKIQEVDCLNKEAFRYHESSSSFAGLATQSASLSVSASALFDRDHPSMGKVRDGIVFQELPQTQLQDVRRKVGLQEWNDGEHEQET